MFFEYRSRNTQEGIRRKEPICIQRVCTCRTKKDTRSLEAQQKTEVMKRICLCVSLCHPLEVKNICHGVQHRGNRNKVLHSYNELLAGEPFIAHWTVASSAAPFKRPKKNQSMFILSLCSKDTAASRRGLNGFT